MDVHIPLVFGAADLFKEQVSFNIFQADVFYTIATVMLFFVVVAVGLIDAGLVQRKNLLDTWLGKFAAAFAAGLGMFLIGYAIWQVSFYEAFGIPHPWGEAISQWWAGGIDVRSLPQTLNPEAAPENDVFQVFLVFFVAYAMVGGALLHSAGLERVKHLPMNIISLVAGAIIMPILLWLTWGSVGPLDNNGVHDYLGTFSLYIFVGTWALIIAWRAGPRVGAFFEEKIDPSQPGTGLLAHKPHNLGLTALGVGVVLFCVPFLALGCGYIVPGTGYFGISMTNSGFGLVVENIFMSFIGGAITGFAISYLTKNPIMALLGPVAGYVGCSTSFDVGRPLGILVVSLIAPVVVYAGYLLMQRLRIDDKKIVPLALFGGVYAALAAGIVGAGKATGGYFEIESGPYAFQHASITFGHQLVGVLVTFGISAISGLVLIIGLEKTIGLRVDRDKEIEGLDETSWGSGPVHEFEDLPAVAPHLAAVARAAVPDTPPSPGTSPPASAAG
ncbi:MAG: ammonium transporter [Actinobacteria bacterium]|nr:ammonium transporter [Actinomycetota bacterium]